MCIFKKKEITTAEEMLDKIVDIIKSLPRAEYNKLKKGMDLFYEGWQQVKKVKTDEEKKLEREAKESADIENIEKLIEKEQ